MAKQKSMLPSTSLPLATAAAGSSLHRIWAVNSFWLHTHHTLSCSSAMQTLPSNHALALAMGDQGRAYRKTKADRVILEVAMILSAAAQAA